VVGKGCLFRKIQKETITIITSKKIVSRFFTEVVDSITFSCIK